MSATSVSWTRRVPLPLGLGGYFFAFLFSALSAPPRRSRYILRRRGALPSLHARCKWSHRIGLLAHARCANMSNPSGPRIAHASGHSALALPGGCRKPTGCGAMATLRDRIGFTTMYWSGNSTRGYGSLNGKRHRDKRREGGCV